MFSRATSIFLVFLAVSVLAHGALMFLQFEPTIAPAEVSLESQMTTVTLVEELPIAALPPEPEPPPPPPEPVPPEPEPEPAPVLAVEESVSEEVVPPKPEPTPEPLPTPTATPTPPKPKPKPAAAPSATPAKSSASTNSASTRTTTVARPDYARNPPPNYPELARRNGWKGTVLVRVQVNAQGNVTSVKLQRGSGYGVLDQAALQSVRSWRFIPRRENGQPLASEVEVPVNFDLRRR